MGEVTKFVFFHAISPDLLFFTGGFGEASSIGVAAGLVPQSVSVTERQRFGRPVSFGVQQTLARADDPPKRVGRRESGLLTGFRGNAVTQ